MDATRCYPLLLSIDYSQRKSKTIIRQDALDLTRVVTDLTFWYSGICNKDAKKLEKIYHELARKTRAMTKQTSKAVKEELITELKKQFPSVEECKASFINRRFTDNNFVKMVLAEIEKCNQQNGEMTLKGPKDVHLEHILPRNPDTSWKKQFSISSDNMTQYAYRFGNYALLWSPLNIKIRNGPFQEKKKSYAQSKVSLTKELAKVKVWDGEAIDRRSEHLFELSQAVWAINN